MKATGIVRKTDDLGRIVLPKELRKTMNIGQKDSLETYIENGMIVLTKYNEELKTSGIVREIDKEGRFTFPKGIRHNLEIKQHDPLEIFIDNERILLKKFNSLKACMITGEVSINNFIFDNGNIVLSKESAKLLYEHIQSYLEINREIQKSPI
ncbi:AbrB/MazE/SpoVT family DNA-binding domain-containing protein [Gottfriedia solisilvae]|uniref:AbrB/MazE/SpoVT family DNA-binding domain-containing protein n=1 Tax=Gottfriedia solisilvae TaxID=1516104 RepID=UPI003D2F12C7